LTGVSKNQQGEFMSNTISQCLNPNCQQQNISGTRVCIRCGTNLVLDNRYRLENFIGEGGFGRTFKAIDEKKLNKPCVVKQFLPQQIGSAALAKATELFKQEAQRLDQLGSHPQIPDLLAFFEQEGRLYLIQQFIDGQDLLKELNQKGRFSESDVRQLLLELLPVLEFIHSHNVIHRDIKPDNIITNHQGKLVLIDFGVSKLLSGSIVTQMGTIAGTPGYAAPEQMQGIVYPTSDLYSLGVTCIRLLTGCLPKEDGSDELFDPVNLQWIWRTKVNVSSNLADLIDQMMERLPRQRPTNASEILQALIANSSVSYSSQQSPRPKSVPTVQLMTQPNRSLNPVVSFSILGILGIGVMAVAVINYSSNKTTSTAEYIPTNKATPTAEYIPTNNIDKCFVETSGDIRSQPYVVDENKINTNETKLFVTATETQGGWVKGNLSNGELAWIHKSQISPSNYNQMKSCLQQKGIEITTIQDDIPNLDKKTSEPIPETNPYKQNTETNTELETTKKTDIEPSESTNPIIKCSTPYHSITVNKNQDSSYTYTAYEIAVSNSKPSIVLPGQKEDDTTMEKYIFKNGNYLYIVYRKFDGQVYLQVNQPGKPPIESTCQ